MSTPLDEQRAWEAMRAAILRRLDGDESQLNETRIRSTSDELVEAMEKNTRVARRKAAA